MNCFYCGRPLEKNVECPRIVRDYDPSDADAALDALLFGGCGRVMCLACAVQVNETTWYCPEHAKQAEESKPT